MNNYININMTNMNNNIQNNKKLFENNKMN